MPPTYGPAPRYQRDLEHLPDIGTDFVCSEPPSNGKKTDSHRWVPGCIQGWIR